MINKSRTFSHWTFPTLERFHPRQLSPAAPTPENSYLGQYPARKIPTSDSNQPGKFPPGTLSAPDIPHLSGKKTHKVALVSSICKDSH